MSEDRGSIVEGLAWCWGINIVQFIVGFPLLAVNNTAGFTVILGIGLVQLVYVVPLFWYWKKKGKIDAVKGLIIAASVTALLNATCWGVVRIASR